MKRKLFSVLLTAALLLSATVPAFADDIPDAESASSANDTSSDAEFSVSASEEGPVEDESNFDAPSAVEGFTAENGADTDDMVSDSDTDTPDEPAADADEIVVLDGAIEPDETSTEDASEMAGEAVAEDASETADETVAEDVSETADEPATEDASEMADESVTEDAADTADEPATETLAIPVTRSISGGGFHSLTAHEPIAESTPEAVSKPVAESAPEMLDEPVAESAPEMPETVEAVTEAETALPETAAVAAMAVSAAPLLPDEPETDEDELFATLFGQIPIISVEVPPTGHILINPYCLKVQRGSDTVQDEIISDVNVLASHSNVALSVQASAIGWAENPSSEVRFVSDTSEMQNKDLFVYYEFLNASDESGDVRWSGSYSGASNQLVVRQGSQNATPTFSEVLTIPAADDDTPSYAALRAFGSASVPDTGRWEATDTVKIQLAFTFTLA